MPLPLANAIGPEVGQVIADVHRDAGVALRLGTGVAGLEGGDRVTGVQLADGSRVDADVVVVGIGVTPCTGWLEGSGLALDDGVVCDATCATGAPGVVAAGDVARWENPLFDESMRIEHWTNAVEQSNHAARRLLEGESVEPFETVPFVWSDQYDRKLQSAGHGIASFVQKRIRGLGIVLDILLELCLDFGAGNRLMVGDDGKRRFVALYGRKGRLTGAIGLNRVRQVMGYRRAIREGVAFDAAVRDAEAS